ncbi:MAG: helix-turn-helix domain-containing protein [Gammaproteobacteria bacterium]
MHTASSPDARLSLIERAREAVLHHGSVDAVPWLAGPIERSWRRCVARGMHPGDRVAFDAVSTAQIRHVLDANRALIDAAAPAIRSLSRAMLHTRYFAILTDSRGTVIDVNGPVDRDDPHAASIARVGVDLSESVVGTTAIGTVLADREAVWLHRGEHFFKDTSVFSCAGAPVLGPDGRCAGMLDLTGVNTQEQPALRHLVAQAARGIENALTLGQAHALLVRLTWPGRVPGNDDDGLVCLDRDGRITGMNPPAAQMLGLPAGQWQGDASTLFATGISALFDAAAQQRGPFEVPVWSGLRLQVLCRLHGQTQAGHQPAGGATSPGVPLRDLEGALIRKAVEDARGNVMEAARALGISRATIYRKLKMQNGRQA